MKNPVINFTLTNEILHPFVSKVVIHDSDDVSSRGDHNPISVKLNVVIGKKRKVPLRPNGWKFSDMVLGGFSKMCDEQLKFSKSIR